MKFSAEWLKHLSGNKDSAERIAEVLSMHAFEAEVTGRQEFDNIIVAKVLKAEKHPNADRLRVVELTDGKRTIAPVVCGAWNFEAGAIVPLALPGAVIPHDQHDPEQKPFTLSRATIRGIESQGMICSGKELGVSDDGSGILLLSDKSELGSTFGVSSETIFDISVPANRPDLVGYRGIAREISALTGSKLDIDEPAGSKAAKPKTLKVTIAAKNLCPKYFAARLAGITVAPSPEFIQKRLKASGLRPINNVVDITNYVMLEIGQPLHAFDASQVIGGILVRQAKPGEKIVTLDGADRNLPTDALVISDSQKVLAVAGVIGGEHSGITNQTSQIILESANFNAVSVRRTSRALGLRTDASARFERNLPLPFVDDALNYAIKLLTEHAGATLVETAKAGETKHQPRKISAETAAVSDLLGTSVFSAEQKKILEKFGFKATGSNKLTVTVPPWRPDVSIWQDLAEEIARYIGLNEIKAQPIKIEPSAHLTDRHVRFRNELAQTLARLDFSEIYTYSFVSAKDLVDWGVDPKSAVEVANPLSLDQQYMRTNLLINDKKSAEFNARFQDSGKYFDIGNVYWMENGKITEETYLCLSAFVKRGSRLQAYEQVAGAFLALSRQLRIPAALKQSEDKATAKIEVAGRKAGYLAVRSDNDSDWAAIHVRFADLMGSAQEPAYAPISRFPAKELDVSVLVDSSLSWAEVRDHLESQHLPLLQDISLFDVYEGSKLPPNKRSLSFRLTYRAEDRTLTDKEIIPIHQELLNKLASTLNLTIRE